MSCGITCISSNLLFFYPTCYNFLLIGIIILCVGYFRYLRALLNARVPSSLEPSVVPPTPMAAAIRDLIMSPLHFSCQASSEEETAFTANNRYLIL